MKYTKFLFVLWLSMACFWPVASQAFTEKEKREVLQYIGVLKTNKDQYQRAKAAKELGVIGHHSALNQLHYTLENDISSQVRISAVNAIARINRKESVKPLVKAVKKNVGRRDVQLAIIRSIGEMKKNSVEVVPVLIQWLKHDNPFVREATAEALWNIRDPRASKYLIYIMKREKDLSVMMFLTSTIADFKDPEAIPALEAIIARPEEKERIKELASESLAKLEAMGLEAPPQKEEKPKKK